MSGVQRRPTGREDVEVRLFLVAGPTPSASDLVLQVFKRAGHDLSAPMGPTAAVVRVPVRYAERLAGLIVQIAGEAAPPPHSLHRED